MLKTIGGAAALALVGGVAAFAQGPAAIQDWTNAPHPPGSVVGPRADDPAYLRYERNLRQSLEARERARNAINSAADVAETAPLPPPASWTGSMDAWNVHMRACVARYRTYDPETDLFFARPGVQTRCKL